MSLITLLANAKEKLTHVLAKDTKPQLAEEKPACVLFFVISNGMGQPHFEIVTGKDFDSKWLRAALSL